MFTQAGVNKIKQTVQAIPLLETIIERILTRLNLVTREEFDIQTAVLRKTRLKLDALEQKVTVLEKKLSD